MADLFAINGNEFGVEEPDWDSLILNYGASDGGNGDELREMARREWRRILSALRGYKTIGAENRHAVERLVMAYIRYDIAIRNVMWEGEVVKSKTGVPMLSMWSVAARGADSDATTLEMELGITPRRRGQTTKAGRLQKTEQKPSDMFLKPVEK